MRPLAEFGAALSLLTRLPASRLVRAAWPPPERCVWAYPLVGVLVGLVGAAVLTAAERIGTPAWPAAILAVAVTSCITGGLHEDGLADTFDALGGHTVERRLAIMRDSRIGAHGALALGLTLLLRTACLASLPPGRAAPALVAAAMLGRASILVSLGLLSPARPDGLAAPLGRASHSRLAAGLSISLVLILFLDGHPGRTAAVAGLATLGVSALARRRFGGFTGDTLGAGAILAECAALLASCSE